MGLGPDRTGLICKQSGPVFWDWTEVRSHGPVQSGLSNGPVYIFWTGLCTVIRASVGEWGLSRTKVCSGAVGVLRVAISESRQGIGRGRDLR